MFAKDISQLEYSDIDDLVNNRNEREGYSLDYKVGFGNLDKAKKELAKDISAFANTGGGYLIIGIDKDYKIVGVDKTIQNKQVDEWINQVLSSNVEPYIFYYDPKVIVIPNSDKVIVVIHVPESTKKPHIVTEWNTYHVRMNDSSKPANHSQIRDMFELSKRRIDEFNDFLAKRNLIDEGQPNFGQNKNSKQLISEVPTKLNRPTPLVIFSLIPKYPNDQKLNLPFAEFHNWLQKHSKGYEPVSSFSIFDGRYDYDIRLDGVVLKSIRNKSLYSYFEILNTGYVEAGFSTSFITVHSNQREKTINGAVTLTPLVVYQMFLLGFARNFFAFAKYFDEVMLQVSFVNMIDFMPWGLHHQFRMGWHGDPPTNRQHDNFKLIAVFNPKTLTDEGILQINKRFSENLCRAFGLTHDHCYFNNQLTLSEMNNFYI